MKSSQTIRINLLLSIAPAILAIPLSSSPIVDKIQQKRATLPAPVKEIAPWYFARISAPKTDTSVYTLTTDGYYYHDPRSGAGVDAYLIDGNIYPNHPDFGGRLTMLGDGAVAKNMAGHGTEVAGIMGGGKYGVAKKVNLLACDITVYGIPGCLRTITARHLQRVAEGSQDFMGSVINISRGSKKSEFGDEVQDQVAALGDAVKAGIHIVVSAGNHANNACDYAPAGLQANIPEMIVVGATGKKELTGDKDAPGVNEIAGYSNTGPCVDIYAPGAMINGPAKNDQYNNDVTGTSAAAPIVAGVVAELLVRRPELRGEPQKMKDFLLGNTSGPNAGRKGVIRGHPELNFLYNGIHEN
ncbi:serine protease [Orbilia ellipsospora]|uniref:Serine protease n=1 Tax=Orbilia ellipsospora TaxID=2528407 RepID=A0AAV9XAV7_9PEZI